MHLHSPILSKFSSFVKIYLGYSGLNKHRWGVLPLWERQAENKTSLEMW